MILSESSSEEGHFWNDSLDDGTLEIGIDDFELKPAEECDICEDEEDDCESLEDDDYFDDDEDDEDDGDDINWDENLSDHGVIRKNRYKKAAGIKPSVSRALEAAKKVKFPWQKMSGKKNKRLIDLINALCKDLMVPNNGMDFSYDNVELIPINQLDRSYLLDLQDELEDIIEEEYDNYDIYLYHNYMWEVLDVYLNFK